MIVPVIVGATGSGKTGVSIEIAKALGRVEIVSADSRTIYKGMDVGTAKPTIKEREGIRHFGFDLVEPGERFTVKDWKDFCEQKINEIQQRGNVPIVVGGTGLYIDALVYDYQFEVEGKGYGKERGKCIKNLNGKSGSLEQNDTAKYPDRQKMCSMYKIFGIMWSSDELKERLKKRAEQMFDNEELFLETRKLIQKYGLEAMARRGDVYKYAWKYLNGEIEKEEAINLCVTKDWHLAKRQMTWFKRNKNICWLPLEKVYTTVLECIQNEQRK